MTKQLVLKHQSPSAQAVAREVVQMVEKGGKVNLGKIMRKHGYSPATAHTPKKVTETSSYRDVIDPFTQAMINERNRIVKQISASKLSGIKYKDLIDALDKLTKNIQLLTGGQTENVGLNQYADNLNLLWKEIRNKRRE